MTNKELKRYDYILAKKDTNIILTLSEHQFLFQHKKEHEESGHTEDLLDGTDAAIIRKIYRLPKDIDMNDYLKERRRIVLRKKFSHRLLDDVPKSQDDCSDDNMRVEVYVDSNSSFINPNRK